MATELTQQEIENYVENYSKIDRELVAVLEERSRTLATKEDLARLEGHTNSRLAEVEGRFQNMITKLSGEMETKIQEAEIGALKRFITLLVIAATILIPVISAALSAVSQSLLNP